MEDYSPAIVALERQLAMVQALQEVIVAISGERELSAILNTVASRTASILEVERVALLLREDDTNKLEVSAHHGLSSKCLASVVASLQNGSVLRLKRPLLVQDARHFPVFGFCPEEGRQNDCQSILVLPLLHAGESHGFVVLCRVAGERFGRVEADVLFNFSRQVAIAIKNAKSFRSERLHEETLAERNRELAALLKTSNFLVEGTDLDEQLSLIASVVREVSGFRVVRVFTVSEDLNSLSLAAEVGLPASEEQESQPPSLPMAEVLARWFREEYKVGNSFLTYNSCLTDGEVKGPEITSGRNLLDLSDRCRRLEDAILIVPLFVRDRRLVGAITVDDPVGGNILTLETIQLLEIFAGQAAIAVRNSRLYLRLRSALRTRDEFLAIASHELKTPLTSIMAYTQHMLQRMSTSNENDPLRSHLEVVDAQARKMARLVQEILDVAALEMGNLRLRRTAVDLGDLVQKTVALVGASSPEHQVVVDTPPRAITSVDESRLRQILEELLENAVKYSPGGGTVRVAIRVDSKEATVSISDEGVGISAEHIERIFERFYQADGNPRTRRFGGMGLGLFVSKKLVEAHGGRIWVESKEGSGSTFYFTVPLHDSQSKQHS